MPDRFTVENAHFRPAIRDRLEGKFNRIVALYFKDPGNPDAAVAMATISAEALNAAWRRKLDKEGGIHADS
ncbi:MAG: hypothetical protein HQK81_06275 [Desulfovibrionaceae bacterium]|nr:hypothetical protein [Desulfovibrionaceae bacterium]MBF0513656.1 hypothetical protein [Desulfovibrionaceae bacterium]